MDKTREEASHWRLCSDGSWVRPSGLGVQCQRAGGASGGVCEGSGAEAGPPQVARKQHVLLPPIASFFASRIGSNLDRRTSPFKNTLTTTRGWHLKQSQCSVDGTQRAPTSAPGVSLAWLHGPLGAQPFWAPSLASSSWRRDTFSCLGLQKLHWLAS